MTNQTTLCKASSGSDQLRTTVPSWLVKQMDLKAGDKLEWNMTGFTEDSAEFSMKVTK